MAQEKKSCMKCGAELLSGATFCSRCGSPVSMAAAPPPSGPAYQVPPTAPPQRYERREKQEKAEKHEKQEKQEKGRGGELGGALIGGGILIWLGLLVWLQQASVITGADFGGLFLIGIGVLLVMGGLVRRTRSGYPLTGFIVGGAIMIVLGSVALAGVRSLLGPLTVGPIFLILLGLFVIVAGLSARRRSPPP